MSEPLTPDQINSILDGENIFSGGSYFEIRDEKGNLVFRSDDPAACDVLRPKDAEELPPTNDDVDRPPSRP